jgi:hypothetical protein
MSGFTITQSTPSVRRPQHYAFCATPILPETRNLKPAVHLPHAAPRTPQRMRAPQLSAHSSFTNKTAIKISDHQQSWGV